MASAINNFDAVNKSQLDNVDDKLDDLLERVIDLDFALENFATAYPTAPQNARLFSTANGEVVLHQTNVTNDSDLNKLYFCMAFFNLGGPGGARDIGISLAKQNTIFASWRKRIRTADRNAEDLYMITGFFSLSPGESTTVVNRLRVFGPNVYYDSRGMMVTSFSF